MDWINVEHYLPGTGVYKQLLLRAKISQTEDKHVYVIGKFNHDESQGKIGFQVFNNIEGYQVFEIEFWCEIR